MNENKEIKTWEDAEKEVVSTQHLAMEVLKREQEKSKAKNIGMVILGVVTALSVVGIVATAVYLSNINLQNEREWRELFNSYDYITQDGEGINNVNSGEQGDLLNEPESKN